ASLLRQIVAGPRSRHPEAGLDLCYVTDNSGYKYAVSCIVGFILKFLSDLVIATSGPSSTYPQRAYRNPTDALVKFLDYKHGANWAIWEFRAEGTGYPDSEVYGRIRHYPWPDHHPPPFALIPNIMASMRDWLKGLDVPKDRVVVVHCKAGKGRSGTVACSYLISEENWTAKDALARFTQRRMRSGFGAGVSIPSQMRWIGYVDEWSKHQKLYVERSIEILEVQVWGLRDGVRVAVEGYVEEGRTIKTFHIFHKHERHLTDESTPSEPSLPESLSVSNDKQPPNSLSTPELPSMNHVPTQPIIKTSSDEHVPGAHAVKFRPSKPLILPTSDINIDFERRNKATYGWTMVTSVAHVWFNTFFEGHGPQNHGDPTSQGVFEIDWDAMDGIKGSARKGTKALDRLAVVWRAVGDGKGVVVSEPREGQNVPETAAADWKGADEEKSGLGGKNLGLRTESPASADVSRASSVKGEAPASVEEGSEDSMKGVKTHGPAGEEHIAHKR
ncbi:MAG: hypothetical protein Q9191_003371, partial [Dirinaria sp. TL-2023a]